MYVQHTVASRPILVNTAFDYERLAGYVVTVVVARVQELYLERMITLSSYYSALLKIFATIDPHVIQRHTR